MPTLSPTGPKDIAIVMMIEPGRYEAYSILLISSILGLVYNDISIHGYCRRSLIGQIHPGTLAFLERHGVSLDPIDPEFEVPYPQGNKLYACAAPRETTATVLMDTDIMIVRQTSLSDIIFPGFVSGRMTGAWMWGGSVEGWRPAYESVGLEVPRYRMMHQRGDYLPPSLSAGFTGYDSADLGRVWVDTALAIEKKRLAKRIYPTLDQISLPVAMARLGLKPRPIDPGWNRGGDMDQALMAKTITHHYQNFDRLRRSHNLWLANAVLRDFSDFEDIDALDAFYAQEGAKPPEVHGNEGHWDAVIREQRKVDQKHQPGRPEGKLDGSLGNNSGNA